MRRILFWSHLLAGVTAGLVILVMSVTGILLAYQRQILAWADHRGLRPVEGRAGPPVPAEELLASAAAAAGASPTSLTLRADPSAPAEVAFGRERTLFLDPANAAVLGEGSTAARAFFESVEAWHRALGGRGSLRETGRRVTGACNLLFLFVVASGPWLWIPRKWTWPNVRGAALFRSGLHGRARDWNWHNAAGIWCAIPLFLIVLSGVVMSYGWANELLYRITGNAPPVQDARSGPRGNGPGRDRARRGNDRWEGLEGLVARARLQAPAWRSITVRLFPPGRSLAFTIEDVGTAPQQRSQLILDRKTGQIVRWEPFTAQNAGRKLRILARFVHTGEAGGLAGQTIGAIACAGGVLLVWTGLWLAGRRFWSWRARRRKSCQPQPCETALT